MANRLQTVRQRVMVLVTGLVLMQALGIFDNAWAFISAGIAAIALGFVAAWSILSNATAALLIMAFRPFRMGDTLELLDSTGGPMGGRVLDMNLMYTTLGAPPDELTPHTDTRVLRVPNNLFFQRVLRVHTPHDPDSKATFFSEPKH
jgi:small-conductance mechanosensitive channel